MAGTDRSMLLAFASGGKTDTKLIVKPYTFADLGQRIQKPRVGSKDGSYYIRGGDLVKPERADEYLKSAELVILDGDSRLDRESGDIIAGAPPMRQVTDALERLGINHIAHTTHSFRPMTETGEPFWKYRILIPCRLENETDLNDAIDFLFEALYRENVWLADVAENRRWSQPWYLPRVPSECALERFEAYLFDAGTFLEIGPIRADADRRRARETSEQNARAAPALGALHIEDRPATAFNRDHGLSWIRDTLARLGYRFTHFDKRREAYRYISPTSETKTAGVVVMRGSRGDWIVYSHHGAHDPLSGKVTDAFALYAHAQHGGSLAQAARSLIRSLQPEQPLAMLGDRNGVTQNNATPKIEPAKRVDTVEAFAFDPTQIPPRPWIVPGMLLHGYVGLLVGTGGAGKSLFTLQLATAIAAGESWGGFNVRKQARVMILNAEDDIPEQRRRLAAIKECMGVDTEKIGDLLLLANDPPSLLITQRDHQTKTQIATRLVAQLVETIREKQIDVLIADPFAETIAGDENASEDIRWVMKTWRDEIARATGCAVLLVHHTPKYSNSMAGDANAARGSGAISAAARTSWTVFPMMQEEANSAGISAIDRHRYVRVDDAKMNYGLLSGTARWFKKVEVDIGNETDRAPSDRVGVLIPWSPPGTFEGISYTAINICLDAIDRGLEDEERKPTGQRYSRRADAEERNVLPLLQERLGVTADRAKLLVKAWLATGLLVDKDYFDPVIRKTRKGLRVDPTKRPAIAPIKD